MKSYWVKYRYGQPQQHLDSGLTQYWDTVSCFVNIGEFEDFQSLESWWKEESSGTCEHELLQVVKL